MSINFRRWRHQGCCHSRRQGVDSPPLSRFQGLARQWVEPSAVCGWIVFASSRFFHRHQRRLVHQVRQAAVVDGQTGVRAIGVEAALRAVTIKYKSSPTLRTHIEPSAPASNLPGGPGLRIGLPSYGLKPSVEPIRRSASVIAEGAPVGMPGGLDPCPLMLQRQSGKVAMMRIMLRDVSWGGLRGHGFACGRGEGMTALFRAGQAGHGLARVTREVHALFGGGDKTILAIPDGLDRGAVIGAGEHRDVTVIS